MININRVVTSYVAMVQKCTHVYNIASIVHDNYTPCSYITTTSKTDESYTHIFIHI